MKRFIFRKDWQSFYDWNMSINKMRRVISSYKNGFKVLEEGEYIEANLWHMNYLEYMRGLEENQKEFICIREKHHISPYNLCTGEEIDFMYKRWKVYVAHFRLNRLDEISNKEVGETIKWACLQRCFSYARIAGVLGIGQDTSDAMKKAKEQYRLMFSIN